MSTTKHTPGPWEIREGDALEIHQVSNDGGIDPIAVINPDTYAPKGTRAHNPELWDCAMSNAALIAAAPELLEMLKALEPDLAWGTTGRYKAQGSDAIRALIAKAEGRS